MKSAESRSADELADAQVLRRISNSLMEETGTGVLYEQILDGARLLMRSDFASLQMFVPERNELMLLAQHGFAPESAKRTACRLTVHLHTS